jgi:electron transport complex protein RnfC
VGDHVLKGQLIAKASEYVSANIHAPSSGKVTAIDEQPIAHPSGLNALCISIACDGNDTWTNLPEPIRAWETTEPQLIRDRLRQSGIVGLGGAVFPTAVKTNTQNKLVDTLILNGSECEPYITCDDMLMRTNP